MKKNDKALKELEKELRKATHAYNEKIRYHKAKGETYMPEKASFREIKKGINSKRDFEKAIKEYRSFGEKGVEKPVKINDVMIITKWEKKLIEKDIKLVNKSRRAKKSMIDKEEVTNQGKKTGYKRGEQSTRKTAELRNKKINWQNVRSRSELQALRQAMSKQSAPSYWKIRDKETQFNYIKGLQKTFGSKAKGLIDKIQKMSNKDFMKIFNSEQNADFDFVYDEFSLDAKLEVLDFIWSLGYDGDIEDYFEL